MNKILDLWVPGRPRTKGSLKDVGGIGANSGRLADTPQSKAWRRKIVDTVIPEIADATVVGGRTRWKLRGGWPKAGVPIVVRCEFYYVKVGETDQPIGRQWGDLDKLLRNVFDALQDAKVYQDDAQVTQVQASKAYGESEGARIVVWES